VLGEVLVLSWVAGILGSGEVGARGTCVRGLSGIGMALLEVAGVDNGWRC
jgi:hypothetical protein